MTDDEVEPSSTEGMSNLMDAMRREQNISLTREAWEDASMIQQALITILDASSGTNPVGMTMGVIERIRSIFQKTAQVSTKSWTQRPCRILPTVCGGPSWNYAWMRIQWLLK